MARKIGLDLSPLRRSKEFRRLYVAGFINAFGAQGTYVVVPFQLKQLTGSAWAVGIIGLFEFVPLVLFGLWGGVLADSVNRKRLILSCESVLCVVTVGLIANSLLRSPSVPVLYVLDAVALGAASLQRASVESLNQRFVDHDLQRQAAALMGLRYNLTSIAGPGLAGLFAATVGPVWVYGFNTATYLISLSMLVGLAATPRGGGARQSQRTAFRAGLAYARGRADILGSYLVDFLAMVLAFPVIMLPFVAARYHEGFALSVLYCGLPVGALLATFTSAWTHKVWHYGRWIVAAAATWGLGVAVLGVAPSLWLAFVGLAVAGFADQISALFRQSLWNESIDPDVRGRMAGLEFISYALGPTLGQFRAGAMAAGLGLRASLAWGGLACSGSILGAGRAVGALWQFDRRTNAYVAEVARVRAASAD